MEDSVEAWTSEDPWRSDRGPSAASSGCPSHQPCWKPRACRCHQRPRGCMRRANHSGRASGLPSGSEGLPCSEGMTADGRTLYERIEESKCMLPGPDGHLPKTASRRGIQSHSLFRVPAGCLTRRLRGGSLAGECELLPLSLFSSLNWHEREGRNTLKIMGVTSHQGGMRQKRRGCNRTIGGLHAIFTA
jgi:hypothetical protein